MTGNDFENDHDNDNDFDGTNMNTSNNLINPLFQHMGLSSPSTRPSQAIANWSKVQQTLLDNPTLARISHCDHGISYPIHFALLNQTTPCPPHVLHTFCSSYPEAITQSTISNLCRYNHTQPNTFQIIFKYQPTFQSSIQKWDIDYIATNQNYNLARAFITQFHITKCIPRSKANWEEWIRHDLHYFWLKCLIQVQHHVVSIDSVYRLNLLEYWMEKGDEDCVKFLLDTYPCLIANEYPPLPPPPSGLDGDHMHMMEHRIGSGLRRTYHSGDLPIQFILRPIKLSSSTSTTTTTNNNNNNANNPPSSLLMTTWNNRSNIVKLLLERGIAYCNSSSSSSGHYKMFEETCGGLYRRDGNNSTPLDHLLRQILNKDTTTAASNDNGDINNATNNDNPVAAAGTGADMVNVNLQVSNEGSDNNTTIEEPNGTLHYYYNQEECKACLQICLQYAHAFMYVSRKKDNNHNDNEETTETVATTTKTEPTSFYHQMKKHLHMNMPILHAAIGVVSTEDYQKIMKLFNLNVTDELFNENACTDNDHNDLNHHNTNNHYHAVNDEGNIHLSFQEQLLRLQQQLQPQQNNNDKPIPPNGKNPLFTLIKIASSRTKPRNGIIYIKNKFDTNKRTRLFIQRLRDGRERERELERLNVAVAAGGGGIPEDARGAREGGAAAAAAGGRERGARPHDFDDFDDFDFFDFDHEDIEEELIWREMRRERDIRRLELRRRIHNNENHNADIRSHLLNNNNNNDDHHQREQPQQQQQPQPNNNNNENNDIHRQQQNEVRRRNLIRNLLRRHRHPDRIGRWERMRRPPLLPLPLPLEHPVNETVTRERQRQQEHHQIVSVLEALLDDFDLDSLLIDIHSLRDIVRLRQRQENNNDNNENNNDNNDANNANAANANANAADAIREPRRHRYPMALARRLRRHVFLLDDIHAARRQRRRDNNRDDDDFFVDEHILTLGSIIEDLNEKDLDDIEECLFQQEYMNSEMKYIEEMLGILLRSVTKVVGGEVYGNFYHQYGQQSKKIEVNCAQIEDQNGRLPLHAAIEGGWGSTSNVNRFHFQDISSGIRRRRNGPGGGRISNIILCIIHNKRCKKFKSLLQTIVNANVNALLAKDGESGFYPFVLAAASTADSSTGSESGVGGQDEEEESGEQIIISENSNRKDDLTMIYEMIVDTPQVVEYVLSDIEETKKKRRMEY